MQSRKHYKNRGFSGNWKKAKMTPFLEKVFFDMVEKVGFTNCVFEKLCFPENTIFIVFSAKNTAFQKPKLYVEKKQKFMKNSGLFLNMAKWCFLGLFFWGFNIKRFVFGVSGIVSKVLKMLVFFPSFWGFSGVAYCCSSGFGRFRCFCVSCVCFSFLCCFCFCFVCFVIGFVVGCCCFVFFCVFLLFFVVFVGFVFFEGLRVRWGGPKGHLTWP